MCGVAAIEPSMFSSSMVRRYYFCLKPFFSLKTPVFLTLCEEKSPGMNYRLLGFALRCSRFDATDKRDHAKLPAFSTEEGLISNMNFSFIQIDFKLDL